MKKLLWALLILIGLLVVAGLVIPNFISADTIKQQLVQQVEKSMGHRIAISGPLKITIFPTSGVHMEDVTISGPIGDEDKTPLMTLKSLDVDVSLIPLLSRKIVINSVRLQQPDIHMQVNAAGQENWRMVSDNKETPAGSSVKKGSAGGNDFSFGKVDIEHGSVSYQNAKTGDSWQMKNVNIEIAPKVAAGNVDWKSKPVKFKVRADDLMALADGKSALTAEVKSDLLTAELDGSVTNRTYSGKAKVASASLRDLMAWLGDGTQGSGAPLKLDLQSNAQCSETACNFTNATIAVDDISATGEAKVTFAGKPSITLNLATGNLDLNPFLPETGKKQASLSFVSNAHAAYEGWSTAPMDFSGLRAFDMTATVAADSILVRKISIGKTTLNARLQDGRLASNVNEADFYKGRATISVNIDASGSIEKRVALKGIDMEAFLRDAEVTDRFTGLADLQLQVNGRGRSEQEIVSSLQGNGVVKVANGVFRGVNMNDLVQNLQSSLKLAEGGSRQTEFSEIGGTLNIHQGIVSNNDLSVKATGMTLAGAGQIDLPQRTISYRLTPQMAGKSNIGSGGQAAAGVALPVIIEGNLENPVFRPDLSGMVREVLKDPKAAKEQLRNTERAIKDQLKDPKQGVKDLKNLLKAF